MTAKHPIISQPTQLVLRSPRLLLKDLTVADAEALFQYRSLPEVKQFQGWAPTSLEDAVRFIEEDICHDMDMPDTWYQLGIFLREEQVLIGDLGIHFLPEDGAIGNAEDGNAEDGKAEAGKAEANESLKGEVEIGVTVAPGFQSRGIASEAIRTMLDFIFDTLHKSKVVASVDPKNQKSMTLMVGIGFYLKGIQKNAVLFRGEWADDAVFEMTAKQWQSHLTPRPNTKHWATPNL